MDSGLFSIDYDEPSPATGKMGSFIVAAGITLLLGVGLAVMAIVFFRAHPAPPKAIEKPPEVRYIREPAPPPKIIIREVEKEPVRAVPVLESPQCLIWEGVWKHQKGQLPMFKLKACDWTVTGLYAPNWSRVLPFKEGRATEDGVEVIVDDSLFRVHFRLTMIDSTAMKGEGWVTDEDWLTSLARGNKQVRTPQQALPVRLQLEENIKLTRKPASIGIFVRGTGG